jgi:hypothetical protein
MHCAAAVPVVARCRSNECMRCFVLCGAASVCAASHWVAVLIKGCNTIRPAGLRCYSWVLHDRCRHHAPKHRLVFWYAYDLLTMLLFAGGFQCRRSARFGWQLTLPRPWFKELVELKCYSSRVAVTARCTVLCSRGGLGHCRQHISFVAALYLQQQLWCIVCSTTVLLLLCYAAGAGFGTADSIPDALLGWVCRGVAKVAYRPLAEAALLVGHCELLCVGWCCLAQRRHQCCIATSMACLVRFVLGGTTHAHILIPALALQHCSTCQICGHLSFLVCGTACSAAAGLGEKAVA